MLRDPESVTALTVPVFKPMELMVEASPRKVFANAHTYHINSISVNRLGLKGRFCAIRIFYYLNNIFIYELIRLVNHLVI